MKVNCGFFARRSCLGIFLCISFLFSFSQSAFAMYGKQRDQYLDSRALFGLSPFNERMTKIAKIVGDQEKIEQVMDSCRKQIDRCEHKKRDYERYNRILQEKGGRKPEQQPEQVKKLKTMLSASFDDGGGIPTTPRAVTPRDTSLFKKHKKEMKKECKVTDDGLYALMFDKFGGKQVEQEDIDALENSIGKHKKALKLFRENSDNLIKALINSTDPNAKLGSIIAQGLAGQQLSSVLEDSDIDSVGSGIKQGVYVRVAGACGEVLGDKVKGSINRMFGGAWDFAENQIVDGWNVLCNVLFHASRDPFSTDEISGWKELIDSVFKDIEALVKEGPKDSSRSYEMTLRQLQAEEEQDEKFTALKTTAWRCLIEGYADQIDFIASEFEDRKIYYKENNLTNRICSFYVNQVVKRLHEFRDILLQANSSNELDRLLDFNKQMIGAYKKNLLMLLSRLSDSLQGFGKSANKTQSSSGKYPMNDFNKGGMGGYGSGFDTDKPYPGSYF